MDNFAQVTDYFQCEIQHVLLCSSQEGQANINCWNRSEAENGAQREWFNTKNEFEGRNQDEGALWFLRWGNTKSTATEAKKCYYCYGPLGH